MFFLYILEKKVIRSILYIEFIIRGEVFFSITLREITKENFKEVIALSTTLPAYQQKCVASNVYSLAEAYVHKDKLVPKAIYL